MLTTIDAAGRIVVPKPLREQLGFGAGQSLELNAVDGRLEVALPATPMHLEERNGQLEVVVEQSMPTLTADVVRETLERVRR